MPRRRDNGFLTSARRFNDIQKRLDLIELKLGGILLIMTRIFGDDDGIREYAEIRKKGDEEE